MSELYTPKTWAADEVEEPVRRQPRWWDTPVDVLGSLILLLVLGAVLQLVFAPQDSLLLWWLVQ